MNFPPRAGRVSGRTTPSLRHAPRAKLQRTNPGSSPLSLRGILFKRSGPALPTGPVKIKFEWATYGEDPTKSPEAMLVFHAPTMATIAQLWQLPEEKAHDM